MANRAVVKTFLEKVKPIILAYRNGGSVDPEQVKEAVDFATPYFEVNDKLLDKMTILATQLDEHEHGLLGPENEVSALVELYNDLEYALSL